MYMHHIIFRFSLGFTCGDTAWETGKDRRKIFSIISSSITQEIKNRLLDADTFSKSGYQKLHTNLEHDTNIDISYQLHKNQLFGEDDITKGDDWLEEIKT